MPKNEQQQAKPVGVYMPDGEGKPVAVFADGDAAARFVRASAAADPFGRKPIIAEATSFNANEKIAKMFADQGVSSPASDASAEIMRGEVLTNQRREMMDEEFRKQNKKEVREGVKETVDAVEEARNQ